MGRSWEWACTRRHGLKRPGRRSTAEDLSQPVSRGVASSAGPASVEARRAALRARHREYPTSFFSACLPARHAAGDDDEPITPTTRRAHARSCRQCIDVSTCDPAGAECSYHMVVPSHAHTFLWFAPTPADRATHERGEAPSSLAVETSQSSAGSPPMETSSDHRKLRTERTQRPIRQGLERRVLRLTTKRVLKRMWAGVSPLPVQIWAGVSPAPVQMWAGVSPAPVRTW